MEILLVLLTVLLLLLLGDFVATFVYHVPEHVFGRYHAIVHHSPNRSFIRYAIRKRQPVALIPGFFSALPYLIFVPVLWLISPVGVLIGLVLAELHVIWRHQFSETYKTPAIIQLICQWLCITTPERHFLHHQNGNLAFGDIFTFYGKPAEQWLCYLRQFKQQYL